MNALLVWFKALPPRERLALSVGAIIVLLLLLYGWIWLPLAADTARMRSSVPNLRSQASLLNAEAAEAKRLGAQPRPVANDVLANAIEQSVAASGLKDRLQVQPLDSSRVQLSADGVGFNEWINLLAALQQTRNARVESARVEPQVDGTLVKVQAVLSRPQVKKPNYPRAMARRPANCAPWPMASSMRSASFHFARRSERANEPTLSWPAFQPTARCTMAVSSDSPERAEIMVPNFDCLPASSAALASVTVPA